jgi:4-hydroxy-tetrahydrodipicolinate synthase
VSLGAIITAVITPMKPDGSIDEAGFVELLGYCAENGSDGFVVCGTTGEAPTLTTEEHLRMIEIAVAERPPGTTVIAGTGSNDTAHAVEMTSRAAALGADAILSVTPYYNRPNRRGVRAHYEAVAAASDLPIVLYNIPTRTGLDLPNDQLAELAEIETIRYVKQANPGNLAPVDGLGIYAGNDDMLADVLELGGEGGILVASHLVGERMRAMVDRPGERAEIDAELRPFFDALGVTTNPIPIKAALEMSGLPAGPLRLPLVEATEEERAAVAGAMAAVGLEPA